jgi:hypothetical protein
MDLCLQGASATRMTACMLDDAESHRGQWIHARVLHCFCCFLLPPILLPLHRVCMDMTITTPPLMHEHVVQLCPTRQGMGGRWEGAASRSALLWCAHAACPKSNKVNRSAHWIHSMCAFNPQQMWTMLDTPGGSMHAWRVLQLCVRHQICFFSDRFGAC